jgi:hypothetical protein
VKAVARWGRTMAVPGKDLQATARQFHLSLPEERQPAFQALVDGFLAPYDRLDGLKEPRREPRHPRDSGARHGQRRTR